MSKQASLASFVTTTTKSNGKAKANKSEAAAASDDVAGEGPERKDLSSGGTLIYPVEADYKQASGVSSYHELDTLLPPQWHYQLREEFQKDYWKNLCSALESRSSKETIFPPRNDIFKAFTACDFDQVKVVIIGQDPYHDDNQAEGLCFSVRRGIAVPPSLRNIYTELENTIPGFKRPKHGSLVEWANQGVLLLNATLTVKAHEANSHKDLGWLKFTQAVINRLANQSENLVWILWGNYAQGLCKGVSAARHCLLKGTHPSPLSQKNFFGCDHFRKCNEYLKSKSKPEIDWKISE